MDISTPQKIYIFSRRRSLPLVYSVFESSSKTHIYKTKAHGKRTTYVNSKERETKTKLILYLVIRLSEDKLYKDTNKNMLAKSSLVFIKSGALQYISLFVYYYTCLFCLICFCLHIISSVLLRVVLSLILSHVFFLGIVLSLPSLKPKF